MAVSMTSLVSRRMLLLLSIAGVLRGWCCFAIADFSILLVFLAMGLARVDAPIIVPHSAHTSLADLHESMEVCEAAQ
jgi:hypothetical protein